MEPEPLVTVTVDDDAGAVYMRFLSRAVARTEEFNDVVLVDLDAYGMVVGFEILDRECAFPLDDLTERYHISASTLAILRAVNDTARRSHALSASTTERQMAYGTVEIGHRSGPWVAQSK